jgi:predicted NodU family carbamoyl transferase
VLAAVKEERFSRLKHDRWFPARAIQYCLAHAGARPGNLAAVAFYEKPLRKVERILRVAACIRNMPIFGQLSDHLAEESSPGRAAA